MVHIYDTASARRIKNLTANDMALNALADPDWTPPESRHYWMELDGTEPVELDVHCRHHGAGVIPTATLARLSGSMAVVEYRASR